MTLRTATRYIAVHCSATPASFDIGRSEIDKWHKSRGWQGIGYHFVIRRSGLVELGRPIGEVGAHVAGFNNASVAICLVGGLDTLAQPEDNFTAAQYGALVTLVKFLDSVYPGAIVQGHRDFSPDLNRDGIITPNEWLKSCPCFDVKQWAIKAGVR